jgi:two-component system sensor histidine kinase AlgZ
MDPAMNIWRKLILMAAINTAGALLPTLFMLLFRRGVTSADFWNFVPHSLAYAWCIGTLCFLVMDFAGDPLWRLGPLWRYPAFALTFAALGLAGCFAACLVLMRFGLVAPLDFWSEFAVSGRISVAFTVLIGAAVTAFEVLVARLRAANEELQHRLFEEERARKLATEARLSSLESRVHPHFLFNTLNSISALVREDPPTAERTVERLAALLRYSLDTGARQLVPLRQELCIVRDYLEIEKTRFGGRLRCRIEVPPEMEELDVPPMTLQLLVENSIKHAVSINRQGGEVAVAARREDGQVVLSVSDDGPGFDLRAICPGHGLENLQERLAALFGGEASLALSQRGQRMVVEVRLPCRSVPA